MWTVAEKTTDSSLFIIRMCKFEMLRLWVMFRMTPALSVSDLIVSLQEDVCSIDIGGIIDLLLEAIVCEKIFSSEKKMLSSLIRKRQARYSFLDLFSATPTMNVFFLLSDSSLSKYSFRRFFLGSSGGLDVGDLHGSLRGRHGRL